MRMPPAFASVDEYISTFPDEVQTTLERVRRAAHEAVPGAGEMISYNMPALTWNGRPFMNFAGWKNHLSIYPAPDGDESFERDIAPYRAERSTLRFPLRQPIPYELIGRVAILLREGSAEQS